MKKLSLVIISLLTTAGMAFAATDVNTHPTSDHHGKPPFGEMREHGKREKSDLPRGFEKLNLTEMQKSKIKAIVEADKPAQHPQMDEASFKQKIQARQAAEQKLMSNKNFDEAVARQMILERQQERMNMERNRAEHELQMLKKRHAIFQVLTPTQQKQLQDEQQSRMGNFLNRKK